MPFDRSAHLDNVSEECHSKGGEHSGLVKHFATDIAAFLNKGRSLELCAFARNSALQPAAEAPTEELAVSLKGSAAMLLTSPGGLKSGVNDKSVELLQNIRGSSVTRNALGEDIVIEGPSSGSYSILLNGSSTGEVQLTLTYSKDSIVEEQNVSIYYRGKALKIPFAFDPAGNPAIQPLLQPQKPESLVSMPYLSAGIEKTRLAWSSVPDLQLSRYRVYSRLETEPHFTLLATLKPARTRYSTPHFWGAPSRLYAVSAVNSSGEESFLSNVVANNAPLVAGIGASPRKGEPPLTVRFTDQSSGKATTWLWDFGDGTTSTKKNPVHTYQTSGLYTVKLMVEGQGENDHEIRESLVVVKQNPTGLAPLSGPKEEVVNTEHTLRGSAAGPEDEPLH